MYQIPESKPKQRCVLFCRVSSKDQEETGYSLPAQEKFLRDYADRSYFSVAKVFAVSESASGRVNRRIFNEMIKYIKKKRISILIVETTDRLTRNFADVPAIDSWILGKGDHQIHLAKEGCILEKNSRSHEWFMWRVKVATAEYYIRLLSENVKKGQKEKLSQGWLPAMPPLGYKVVGESGHKIHVIDEEKSQLVKRMFELYGKGTYSLKAIGKLMYNEGLHSRAGKRLSISFIHRLLTDPFFIGKIKWNNNIYEGSHEPLISSDLFDRVQNILSGRTAPYYNKHNMLFRGTFRCFKCGRSISWERHNKQVYGHCHFTPCPQKKWYKEEETERQVLSVFSGLQIKNEKLIEWVRKALKGSHQDEMAYRKSSLSELQQEHSKLQRRLDKLYDDRLDEVVDKETYERRFRQYTNEKEKTEDRMKRYSQTNTGYFELGMNLYEISQNALHIYQKADIDRKRELISLVFTKLMIDDGKIVYEFSKPFEALASAVKATNDSKVAELAGSRILTFEASKNGYIKPKNGDICSFHSTWLAFWDGFRSFRWAKHIDSLSFWLKQAKELNGLINVNSPTTTI